MVIFCGESKVRLRFRPSEERELVLVVEVAGRSGCELEDLCVIWKEGEIGGLLEEEYGRGGVSS